MGVKTWTVEFDFFAGKPMAMKTGFKTEEEAQMWALFYARDGIVVEEVSDER